MVTELPVDGNSTSVDGIMTSGEDNLVFGDSNSASELFSIAKWKRKQFEI